MENLLQTCSIMDVNIFFSHVWMYAVCGGAASRRIPVPDFRLQRHSLDEGSGVPHVQDSRELPHDWLPALLDPLGRCENLPRQSNQPSHHF